MTNYKSKYFDFFQYGIDEPVLSEISDRIADDCHHIITRGKTHKNQHAIKNLMALTREEHDKCHSREITEEQAQDYHDKFVISFLTKNPSKIQELDDASLDYYTSRIIESDPYKEKLTPRN